MSIFGQHITLSFQSCAIWLLRMIPSVLYPGFKKGVHWRLGRWPVVCISTLLKRYSWRGRINKHTQRIGALAWNTYVLSSGSRDKSVHHSDVREAGMRPFKRCAGLRQEVCGLKWSGDGGPGAATLASGCNDSKVCIWDLRGSRRVVGGSGVVSGDDAPGDAQNALMRLHVLVIVFKFAKRVYLLMNYFQSFITADARRKLTTSSSPLL